MIARRFFSRKCDSSLRIIGTVALDRLEGGLSHNTSPSEKDFVQIATHPWGILGYHVSETGYYPAFSFRESKNYSKVVRPLTKKSIIPPVIENSMFGMFIGFMGAVTLQIDTEAARNLVLLSTTVGGLLGVSGGIRVNEKLLDDHTQEMQAFLGGLGNSTPLSPDLEEHRKRIIEDLRK